MRNFITIEGCEGVGKTYQTKLLRQYCEERGLNVVFTREPGGSDIAEQIRRIILDANNNDMDDLCEAFLYAASRIQHLKDIVKPALEAGKAVICDRYVDSSYVYQGLGRGLGLEKIVRLNQIAVGEYMPEFTIFLDLSPEFAFKRKGGADQNDRMEAVGYDFHLKVYGGYKSLEKKYPRIVAVDCGGTKYESAENIKNLLKAKNIIN